MSPATVQPPAALLRLTAIRAAQLKLHDAIADPCRQMHGLAGRMCVRCRPCRPVFGIGIGKLVLARRAVRHEDAYFTKLYSALDMAMSVTKPQRSLLLAVDGPAPLAKLLLQR